MNDDLIKRSDAIKATWQEPTYTDPLNVLTEVRDRIEAIPSADRLQGEWIPCSERLPSEFSDDERVLATTEVDGLGVILTPTYYVKSWYRKGYITAWMPLPAPWKGADDE